MLTDATKQTNQKLNINEKIKESLKTESSANESSQNSIGSIS